MTEGKIAVIGDSHVSFFGGHENISFRQLLHKPHIWRGAWIINTCGELIENFRTFHLGPALAFSLNKHGTSTMAREKAEFLLEYEVIAKNQPVMCAFGEIDCRAHVLSQAEKKGLDFRQVIDDISSCYLEFLQYLSREHSVYVWGPIPSQSDESKMNPAFPRYGTEIQRNIATKYFNERMKNICDENGFKFISIFSSLVDENMRTKTEYIADGCHLSQKAWEFGVPEFRKHGISVKFSPEAKKRSILRMDGRFVSALRYYAVKCRHYISKRKRD